MSGLRELFQPPVFEETTMTKTAQDLHALSLLVTVVSIIVTGLALVINVPLDLVITFEVPILLVNLATLFLLRFGYIQEASRFFIWTLWLVFSILLFVAYDIKDSVFTSYLFVIISAYLLLGRQAGILFAGLSLVMSGVSTIFISDIIEFFAIPGFQILGREIILIQGVTLLLSVFALHLLTRRIDTVQTALTAAESALADLRVTSQHQFDSVKRELGLELSMLRKAANVVRGIPDISDLDRLLMVSADAIGESFDFNHVGIYMVDPIEEMAVLWAASSELGKYMVAEGYRLPLHESATSDTLNSITQVLNTGQPFVLEFLPRNVDFPLSRSQAVIPLYAQNQIIGALDVQAKEPSGFGEAVLEALDVVADLLANSVVNARLYSESMTALAALRRSSGQLTLESWIEFVSARTRLGYELDDKGLRPLKAGETVTPFETGGSFMSPLEADARHLELPVMVRGQVIGYLDLDKSEIAGSWTQDEIEQLEPLVEQLGLALDSARQFEDTQLRAERERLVGEISARLARTLDVETMLRVATQELGQLPNVSEVAVHLGGESRHITTGLLPPVESDAD
ncbi:MAG: GAF domain-containing protein [Anaerolineae bacterium]|nr:GAF domain-containing protein [Anaerolineae bacterium]